MISDITLDQKKSPLQMIDEENPLITNEIKWPDNNKNLDICCRVI